MRIAFFTHRFPVTSEAFIMNAVTGLLRAGHDVDLYALHGEGDFETELAANDRFPGRFRLSVFKLRETPRRRIALAPVAGAHLISRHGLSGLRAVDPRRFGSDGPNLVALHEAGLFRQQWRYDILHCQFGTLAEPILNHRDAGFITGRVFVHFRGYDISGGLNNCPSAYQSVFQRADGFLTNCDFFRRRLEDVGAPKERLTIIPSAIDTELFSYRPRPWLPGERLRILCVGRLVEKKGFRYAIEAVAGLVADGVDVECRMIGEGPMRSELETLAATLGLGDRVKLPGAALQAEVADALEHAHVFLAPSMTASNGDQDASINTLKEAMATGRPFVSTRHGGIPELVAGLQAGVLAPERDAAALRRGVHDLLRRMGEWPEMTARARARVEKEFSIDAATEQTLAAYGGFETRADQHARAAS